MTTAFDGLGPYLNPEPIMPVLEKKPLFDKKLFRGFDYNYRTSLPFSNAYYPEALERLKQDMMDALRDKEEEYLLGIFGSLEWAKKYGHLYVVEQRPIELRTDEDIDLNEIQYMASTEMRVRPKTYEELKQDGVAFPELAFAFEVQHKCEYCVGFRIHYSTPE